MDVFQRSYFLFGKGTSRKLHLFLCACCRRAYDRLPEEQRRRVVRMAYWFVRDSDVDPGKVWEVCRNAVAVAERFADGLATEAESQHAARAARSVGGHFVQVASFAPGPDNPHYDAAAVSMGSDAAFA